ncbi:MAG TPA: hypothetical protein VFS46_02245, partial [Nitrososphaera sp.]|nr:hypothetical protein [Nitrososphaera sp.]
LDLFDDPNIKKKEAKKVIARIMTLIKSYSNRLLVVASLQETKYADLVMPSFDKRIVLSDLKHGKLNAELYDAGKTAAVSLTNKDLKIARRR